MQRFIEGADRTQARLLPEYVEDYVEANNPVRITEAFVDQLDARQMGCADIEPEATGRPAHHSAVPLKIYIYGDLNRIQSSRRLGAELRRPRLFPHSAGPRTSAEPCRGGT